MTPQEQKQLDQFLQQLVEVKLAEKDQAAQTLINQAIARQPDAAYLLVQRCLIQDQALQTAQTQIADLQQQLQQKNAVSSGKNFLDGNPWASATSTNEDVPGASNYQPPAASANQAYARPAAPSPTAGFGSSFLGNVATTAAGVVAGSFLFQGIGNLLGHHASPSSLGQEAAGEQLAEQTTINNYYGDGEHSAGNSMNDVHQASYEDDDFMDESDFDSDWV